MNEFLSEFENSKKKFPFKFCSLKVWFKNGTVRNRKYQRDTYKNILILEHFNILGGLKKKCLNIL